MTTMGFDPVIIAQERNFFAKELEKVDWGPGTMDNPDLDGDDMVWEGPPLFQTS